MEGSGRFDSHRAVLINVKVIFVSRLLGEHAGYKGNALAIPSSPFEIPSRIHKGEI